MDKKARKIYLIFTIFYIYFVMSLFESSRGNFIPFFIDEFQINNAIVSFIIGLNSIGCVVGSFLAGYMCDRFGHKFVFIFGCGVATVSIFMAPFISNVYMLAIFYFMFGIGRSFLSISIDSIVPVLSVGYEVVLMNITHFMYGLGGFVGQNIYGALLFDGMPWRSIYIYVGFFFILAFVFTLFMKLPRITYVDENVQINRQELYRNPILYLFIIAIAFGSLNESMLTTWFVNYMRSSYGLNPADASAFASAFFMFFTGGRLIGGFIVMKLGSTKGLICFNIIGAICILCGLVLKESGLMLIAFSGFFTSVSFPTLMVIISGTFKKSSSLAIGLSVTFGNLIYIGLLSIVGIFNDIFGTYVAFFLTPVSMIFYATMIIIISKKIRYSTIQ